MFQSSRTLQNHALTWINQAQGSLNQGFFAKAEMEFLNAEKVMNMSNDVSFEARCMLVRAMLGRVAAEFNSLAKKEVITHKQVIDRVSNIDNMLAALGARVSMDGHQLQAYRELQCCRNDIVRHFSNDVTTRMSVVSQEGGSSDDAPQSMCCDDIPLASSVAAIPVAADSLFTQFNPSELRREEAPFSRRRLKISEEEPIERKRPPERSHYNPDEKSIRNWGWAKLPSDTLWSAEEDRGCKENEVNVSSRQYMPQYR